MSRFLAFASIAALLTAAAHAQCLGPASGTTVVGAGFVKWSSGSGYASTYIFQDEGITNPPIALTAFPSFPMAGAVGNLDQLWVNSNGEVYLTDSTLGLAQPAGGIQFGATDLAEMRGATAGASARVVALGGDNAASTMAGAVWDIAVDQTVPGQVRITWTDMARLGSTTTDKFSFDCTLFSSGVVQFSYSLSVPAAARYVGISIGNNVGSTSSPSQDLANGADSGTVGLLYEAFTAVTWDMSDSTLLIAPNGLGGYTSARTCGAPVPAFHASYGVGCYSYTEATETFFQLFATTAAAGATLTGNSMTLFPNGNGYVAAWNAGGGAAFVAPSGGATSLPTGDDTSHTITPSTPVSSPFGASTQVTISHNGIITLAATANTTGYLPTGALVASHTVGTGFYSWYDYNDAETTPVASGRIKHEEVGGVLYITWDGVEGYTGTAGPSNPFTFQFQIDLASGVVTYVWTVIPAAGLAGRELLVGYTDPGVSMTPAAIDLPTALPIVTQPDISLSPLSLSASPSPVFTIGGPTVPITYTVNNVIDLAPPFGIGLTLLIFSVAPFPGGLDMGFVGMPGCNLNILSLDVILGMPGAAPTDTLVLTIPQPLAPGLSFYSQALSLFAPNSLPNGQNAFGGVLSNGLRSSFNTF